MDATDLYRPPAPKPKSIAGAIAAATLLGQRDILSLLPEDSYRTFVGRAPIGKRPILIINNPQLVRQVLIRDVDRFPKSDLMVGALTPLVGDGIFISGGERWAHQRRLIDPAFAHMRIRTAFTQMQAATTDFEARLDEAASRGEELELDEEMSHLTADIVFRTIFSEPIVGDDARAVFRAFAAYQNAVPQIEPKTLLGSRPWETIETPKKVAETCGLIREKLGVLIDRRLASGENLPDIAGDIIAARDPETGEGFSREELIDQIAVFFLAGHETSASALTWAFFILSQRPEILARIRDEVAEVVGDGPVEFAHTRALPFTRNVFREVLRLYPPVSFITRIATEDMELGPEKAPRGSLIVISPWLIQRHRRFWKKPDRFDPDRFSPAREKNVRPGTYLPFGLGPRVCTGASFATAESVLILASLSRRYDFRTMNPKRIMPVGKLTTRPRDPVRIKVARRSDSSL